MPLLISTWQDIGVKQRGETEKLVIEIQIYYRQPLLLPFGARLCYFRAWFILIVSFGTSDGNVRRLMPHSSSCLESEPYWCTMRFWILVSVCGCDLGFVFFPSLCVSYFRHPRPQDVFPVYVNVSVLLACIPKKYTMALDSP